MASKEKKVRHVCGISGGKDSAALAIYLMEKRDIPEIEYFFSDTGKELPEVYEYLDRLEAHLGQEIVRICSGKDFDHYLKIYGGFLPSPRQRWCTKEMKIRPFEKWVGDDECISYVGIRADENREGYISTKPNIKPVFPFKEDGIRKEDVFRILENSVGVPEYYKWRSRSGCYFCFFQRRSEWVGLKQHHPSLFEAAKAYEKDLGDGRLYSWIQDLSLEQLEEKATEIEARAKSQPEKKIRQSWQDLIGGEDELDEGCLICHL